MKNISRFVHLCGLFDWSQVGSDGERGRNRTFKLLIIPTVKLIWTKPPRVLPCQEGFRFRVDK
jgi:hypothetical protein